MDIYLLQFLPYLSVEIKATSFQWNTHFEHDTKQFSIFYFSIRKPRAKYETKPFAFLRTLLSFLGNRQLVKKNPFILFIHKRKH